MSVDNSEVIDAVAYENDKFILQIYDHLEFDKETENDHMFMIQDKLNAYIWYVDNKQYKETYPDKDFSVFEIQIKFKYQPSYFCIEYLEHVNEKLKALNICVTFEVAG